MKNYHNLEEIRKQVDMYFDHALTKEDEDRLLSMVKNDPAYFRVFTREQSMREKIRKNVHRPGVSPDLIQAIKDNIRVS